MESILVEAPAEVVTGLHVRRVGTYRAHGRDVGAHEDVRDSNGRRGPQGGFSAPAPPGVEGTDTVFRHVRQHFSQPCGQTVALTGFRTSRTPLRNDTLYICPPSFAVPCARPSLLSNCVSVHCIALIATRPP